MDYWRLDLCDNQLTKLPDEIGELKELEWLYVRMDYWRLDLCNNQLTKLPDEIGELKELERLNVRMDYWVLLLSDNQLTTLPDDIGELKELEMLLVTGNPVTQQKMKKVVKIQKLSSCTHKTMSVYTCTAKGFFLNF